MPQKKFYKHGFKILFIEVCNGERWTASMHTFDDMTLPLCCGRPHGGVTGFHCSWSPDESRRLELRKLGFQTFLGLECCEV